MARDVTNELEADQFARDMIAPRSNEEGEGADLGDEELAGGVVGGPGDAAGDGEEEGEAHAGATLH